MPDPSRTAEIWREEAWKAGIGDLYLVRVESIGKCNPSEINFDAALEFAPDWWNKGQQIRKYSKNEEESNLALEKFDNIFARNYIHIYDKLVETMLAKPTPNYKWIRCITPSWDNSARRNEGAHVFLESDPDKYKYWLDQIIDSTKKRLSGDEKMVFINAWNEWAEGNHLEPDQKYKRGYLEATYSALKPNDSLLTEKLKEIELLNPETAMKPRSYEIATDSSKEKIIDLDPKIIEQQEKIASLENILSHKDMQISEIYNSRSWLVTAPLRSIFQKFYNIKKNLAKFKNHK
jgi:hypothetical protein